jgi:hypothetical protein
LSIDGLTINRRAVVLALVASLGAAPSAQRQTSSAVKNSRSTFTEHRRKEVQAILAIADDLAAGRPVPNDLALTWVRDDLFKAQDNKQYIPFIVSLDPGKLATPAGPAAQNGETLEMYWRVVPRSVSTPVAATPADGSDLKNNVRPDVAYEDITPAPVVAGPALRLSRSFVASPGTYDVYVVVRETAAPVRAAAPKVSAIKRAVVVPDLWNGELNMSAVILAERIEPLTTALTPQQRTTRPYALETVELVPFTRTRFSKREEISAFLQIYHARTDAGNKPDVSVQFNFYAKQAAGGEKFFNNTMPTNLNARTLPKEFSLASGRQLQTGQAVQLATFPEGEYRLEIRVTDNLAKKTLARDVSFAVSAI